VIVASACWGTIGIATLQLPAGVSPLSVAAARMLIGGGTLLIVVARPERIRRLLRSRRATLGLGLAVLLMTCYQLTYFTTITLIGPALSSVLEMGSTPIFVGLITALGGVRTSARWWLSTAGAIAGCVLLVINGLQVGGRMLPGIAGALITAAAYAGFTTLVARLIAGGGCPKVTMAVVFGGSGLLLSPILLTGSAGWVTTPTGIAVALYLGLAASAGAYLLYGHALRTVSGPLASTLTLAEPATATALSVLVLGQRIDQLASAGLALIGATLALAAAPARAFRRRREPRHSLPPARPSSFRPVDERVRWTPSSSFPSLD
jgi:DME family drug/metabolite transporter